MKKLTQSNKFLVYIWLPSLVAGIFLFNVLYIGWATEFRPAGPSATGVTSDGNNVFTGTNVFQGNVTVESGFVMQGVTTISNAQPTLEFSDTTALEDDFILQVQGSGIHLRNEQDSVTYLTVDSAQLFTLGNSTGGLILNGAGGAVSVENATPIFELSDTNADDFLLRANTSVLTLENEADSVTYLNIDGATSHNITLGSTSGATIFTGVGGSVTVENATPIFELSDTTGAEDDFLFRGQTSQFTLENETDAITYITIASTHNLSLGSTSGTTTLTSSSSVTNSVPVTIDNAAPTFELQDTDADDFLFQVNASQLDLLNETDNIIYFTADANHLVTVGSSSGGTLLNGAGGAVSVANATPIFELQDTTGAEDDFLLRAQTSAFTLENETDGVTYLSVASNHNLTLGSSSGSTLITNFSPTVITIDSAISVLEFQDSTASEDDYFFRAEGSTFSFRNEQDGVEFFSIDVNNDIQIGNSSDSAIVITADSGGIMFGGATYPRVVTMADGATISWNAALGNFFRVTLAGNRTINGGTGARDGQRVFLQFVQDGTGSRTVTFAAGITNFRFGSDTISTDCVLSVGASSSDFVAIVFNSIASFWEILACSRGF